MMIATARATSGSSGSGTALSPRSVRIFVRRLIGGQGLCPRESPGRVRTGPCQALLTLTVPGAAKVHGARRRQDARRRGRHARPRLAQALGQPRTTSAEVRSTSADSNFHDLGFFAVQELVDVLRVLVGELLEAVLAAVLVVCADVAVVDQLLQVVHAVAADVADGDAAFLGEMPHDLDELLAAFLGQLRDRQADELAVVR